MKYYLSTLLLCFVLIGCDTKEEPVITPADNLETTIQYKTIAGIDANHNSLDIYHTSDLDANRPVVIWVHGGAWAIGDKANSMDNKVGLLRDQEDYVLVSINYRLSPFPVELANADRVMFPTHNTDVADAIKWVYDHIADYGGDHDKIALMGHSAGAHLVSLTGTNQAFLEDVGLSLSDIKGVAAIDTEGYDIADELDPDNREDFHINAFGLDVSTYTAASPIENINSSKDHPDYFIAKRGTDSRIAKADAFISALEQNGVAVSQVDGSIYDHEGINAAIGDASDTVVTPELVAFFKEVLE